MKIVTCIPARWFDYDFEENWKLLFLTLWERAVAGWRWRPRQLALPMQTFLMQFLYNFFYRSFYFFNEFINLVFSSFDCANNIIKPHKIRCCWRDYFSCIHIRMRNVYDLIISLIQKTESICMWFDLTTAFGLAWRKYARRRIRFPSDYCLRAYALFTFSHNFFLPLLLAATASQLIMHEKRQLTSDSLIMRWRAETTSFHKLQSSLISIILFVNSHSRSCSQAERNWYEQSSHKRPRSEFHLSLN